MRKTSRICAVLLAATAFGACGTEAGNAELSIAVDGNRLVDGAGETVRPLGVNRPGPEYACTYGWLAEGPGPTAEDPGGTNPLNDVAAIASWHANAVRVPLNQDCWLGLHGLLRHRPLGRGYRDGAGPHPGGGAEPITCRP